MKKQRDLRATVLTELARIAPELEAASLDPAMSFRDQLEFDSVDFLKLMMALEKRLGVTIREADFPRLSSLDGCVRYLSEATGRG